ncbi:molybdopterin-guanine dinucleotide biosynthesis protein B [Cytobacillus sp. Hz8]|uniref:molybdopterin-guanine dinucleotide biosynthesis protein B n=1 Tax=Cytobacillus sp. Hz8 TaxID=3347168 RepID=UPI0035DF099A
MVTPKIIQIVGFQNSGKTSFLNTTIHELANDGYKIATIKHHGHGGKPSVVEDKDSSLHLKAGAVASLVEGEGRLLLQAEDVRWSLEEKIQFLSSFQLDFIFIEGHKHENYEKVVLLRNKEDVESLAALTNVKAIYYWNELNIRSFQRMEAAIPCFQINDAKGRTYFTEFLLSQRQTKEI